MNETDEAPNSTETTENDLRLKDRHGKVVTMPQRRRENNFKKGVSGNPNGKPKGALQKKTILEGMMKYNMIVSPTLLRRSEAVLEKIVERAEQEVKLDECDSPEDYAIKLRAKEKAEDMIVTHILTPFIKMQALKQSGLKSESRPTVNINISKADGLNIDRKTALDAD